jgi:multiple sugar transport system permease protein
MSGTRLRARGRRRRGGLQIGLSLLAVVILFWTLFPVYHMLLLSFTPTDDLFQPGLYVAHLTVRNYTYTMGQDNPFVRYFWHQLSNSLVIALWSMVLVAAIAALGSFAMARMNFRFRRYVSGLTLFTYVIPSSFLSIPFFKMMADYDLIDTKLSVILAMVTFASPYALWVLSDYARSLPPEIEEAGAIDGAGTLAIFFYLYLPLIRPPLIAIGTYAFLYAWNEYLYALLLLTGEPRVTLPVAMSNFLTTDNAPWNLLMAVSTVYAIPPVVLYYCFKRYLVSGLVSGAVSGT